jgi:nitrite reductase/ring-hydroxylating ferredoxin subunit
MESHLDAYHSCVTLGKKPVFFWEKVGEIVASLQNCSYIYIINKKILKI